MEPNSIVDLDTIIPVGAALAGAVVGGGITWLLEWRREKRHSYNRRHIAEMATSDALMEFEQTCAYRSVLPQHWERPDITDAFFSYINCPQMKMSNHPDIISELSGGDAEKILSLFFDIRDYNSRIDTLCTYFSRGGYEIEAVFDRIDIEVLRLVGFCKEAQCIRSNFATTPTIGSNKDAAEKHDNIERIATEKRDKLDKRAIEKWAEAFAIIIYHYGYPTEFYEDPEANRKKLNVAFQLFVGPPEVFCREEFRGTVLDYLSKVIARAEEGPPVEDFENKTAEYHAKMLIEYFECARHENISQNQRVEFFIRLKSVYDDIGGSYGKRDVKEFDRVGVRESLFLAMQHLIDDPRSIKAPVKDDVA